MTVRSYSNFDASSPTLNSTRGSLITLLDAVLVNGYGSKPSLGWTIAYTATNKRVYLQGKASGNQVLKVDEATTSAGHFAYIQAGSSATGIDSLVNQTPSLSQSPTGLAIYKNYSYYGNSGWNISGDESTFIISITAQNDRNNGGFTFYIGDIFSYKTTTDNFKFVIHGMNSDPSASHGDYSMGSYTFGRPGNSVNAVDSYMYIVKSYDEISTSKQIGRVTDSAKMYSYSGNGGIDYPNPVDGGLYLAPYYVNEIVAGKPVIRGEYRGIWGICHNNPFNDQDTIQGSGAFAGKTFLNIRQYHSPSGALMIETSNTWNTN